MQGVVVDGGGGVMVWVVGCRCQGWVVQGVVINGGGGWWCGGVGGRSLSLVVTQGVEWWWWL